MKGLIVNICRCGSFYFMLGIFLLWLYGCQVPVVNSFMEYDDYGLSNSCNGTFPSSQLNSLEILYNATGGATHWVWSENYTINGIPWNFSQSSDSYINPCSSRWQYLTCNSHCEVVSLELDGAGLIGTLPGNVFVGLVETLTVLTISNHDPLLTGKLPWSLSSLAAIETINLSNNNFSSTIPTDLGNKLTRCRYLQINGNGLTGSLPSSLGLMESLIIFEGHENSLSGYLPSTLTQLRNLQQLDIGGNRIIGTLPLYIGEIKSLVSLNLSSNLLYGTIPESLYTLVNLSDFEVSRNLLSGTISSNIQSLTELSYLQIDHNSFTRELPDELGFLPKLVAIYAHFNSFTGNIPDSFGKLHQLEAMYLSSNRISGILPDSFQNLSNLLMLNISHNYLFGSLSSSIYSLNRLKYLDISYNHFSGPVGSFIAEMNNLTAAFLQDNHLSGKIDNLVDPKTQYSLEFLDIAYNAFTSHLSNKVFQLPSIKVFCAMNNCLEGSIPSTICEANKTLVVLGLDGLHSSPQCTNPYMTTSNSYPLYHIIEGSIPSCLFTDFHQLTTLHMSGNGIENSLPPVNNVTKALNDLTLSHNQLVGTIPHGIMVHPWRILDLSFNKISGSISDNIHDFTDVDANTTNSFTSQNGRAVFTSSTSTASQLYLNINRLSGNIPKKLRSVKNIQILQGNIFYCDAAKSSLPINDPEHDSYDCGSNNVNFTIFAWIGLICVFFTVMLLYVFRNILFREWKWILARLSEMESSVLGYWEIYRSNASPIFLNQSIEQLVEVGLVCRQLRVWIMKVTLLTVVIFIPLYVVFNSRFSTYRFTYAWTLSMGFFSGVPPAVVMTIILASFLIFVFLKPLKIFRINVHYVVDHMSAKSDRLHQHVQQSEKRIRPVTVRFTSLSCSLYRNVGCLILIDLFLVLVVNIFFVTINGSNEYSLASKQTVGVFVTLFKVGWNNVLFIMFKFAVNKKSIIQMDDELYSFFATCMTWLSIFNQVVFPCVAELLFNANCYDYTINSAPNVDISYTAPLCSITFSARNGLPIIDCDGIQIKRRTYNPPFFYSYQCSSSIMTDFVEIFILRFFVSGFFIPFFRTICKAIQEYIRDSYGIHHPLLKYLNNFIPFPLRIYKNPPEDWSVLPVPAQAFMAENFVIDTITDISIVLTFGVIFPPLAIIGCISIIFSTAITQLMLGRLVYLARSQPDLADIVQKVNNDCAGVRAAAARGLVPLSAVLSMFWAYFLFDILGDAVGYKKALFLLIVMALIPTWIFFANFMFKEWNNKHSKGINSEIDCNSGDQVEMEMPEFKMSHNFASNPVDVISSSNRKTVSTCELSTNPMHETLSSRPLPGTPICSTSEDNLY